MAAAPAIARSRLLADLRALGVREGSALMVHVRMSALGWVIGGSGTVVSALLEALGPEGTLMAYASWQEHVYHAGEWPPEHRDAYLAEPPVFDPATAEAARDHGRIPERVRTWPGAERSVHPEASMVAIGRLARELTADHPQDDGYGPDSPLGRLVAWGGDVELSRKVHLASIECVPGAARNVALGRRRFPQQSRLRADAGQQRVSKLPRRMRRGLRYAERRLSPAAARAIR